MSDADFSEVTRLAADLARVETQVDQRAAEVIYETSNAIRDTAKQLAPVDTGALRDSISAGMHSDGLGASIGPTVDYGLQGEYGTTTKAPRPFLAPAADRHCRGLPASRGTPGQRDVVTRGTPLHR